MLGGQLAVCECAALKGEAGRVDRRAVDVLPGGEQAGQPSAYAEWLDDLVMRGPVSRFLVLSVPTGVLFGAFSGVRAMSPEVGLISGVAFGVFFGVTMTAVIWSRMRPLRALSRAQLRQVTTLVRRGTTTVPPDVAPAVVTYSGIVHRAQSSSGQRQRSSRRHYLLLVGFAVLDALIHPHPGVLLSDAMIAILLVRHVRTRPRIRARILANAASAQRAATAAMQH